MDTRDFATMEWLGTYGRVDDTHLVYFSHADGDF